MEADLRAEARRTLEERQSREIYCHITGASAPYDRCLCERCKRGIPPGPDDWTTMIVNVGGDGDASSGSTRSESELLDTAPRDEEQPPVTDVAPQERDLEQSISEHDRRVARRSSAPAAPESDDQARDERCRAFVEPRRRPRVRKPPYRRRTWPPSAYGA